MKIYRITDIGESEASQPMANPSDSRKILYYLHRRNGAASDDMITAVVFNGDKDKFAIARNKLIGAKAIVPVG